MGRRTKQQQMIRSRDALVSVTRRRLAIPAAEKVKVWRLGELIAKQLHAPPPVTKRQAWDLLWRFAGDVTPGQRPGTAVVEAVADGFLHSYAWRRLRYEVIKERGARCECCGRGPSDGATIHVDHVKPRRKYPELALDKQNLQVLCGACNHGKGNWDETDWRATAQTATPVEDLTERLWVELRQAAPTCVDCQRQASSARWRVFRNGDVHLVWWCCDAQVSAVCVAPQWADRFGAGLRPVERGPETMVPTLVKEGARARGLARGRGIRFTSR